GAAPVYGTWSWSWTWLFADGSSWSLDWQQACACAWDWNWTWDWSQQPPSGAAFTPTPAAAGGGVTDTATGFDAASDDGPVSQSNAVGAEASASVSLATLSQVSSAQTADATQDPAAGTQDPGGLVDQRLQSSQAGQAFADSAQ